MSHVTALGGSRGPILYISYDGALDPLGRSQVVPYVEGLSARGYRYHLITFEKPARWADHAGRRQMRSRLAGSGIRWHPLRYHRRPPVAASAYDILRGFLLARRVAGEEGVRLVHARSYPSALVAFWLHMSRGIPYVFDMRGFYPEERVDGGLWPAGGAVYQVAKRLERSFLRDAAAVVTLTEASLPQLQREMTLAGGRGPVSVIPTSVDLRRFSPPRSVEGPFTLAYFGSVGTWYLVDEMIRLAGAVLDRIPESRLRFVVNDGEAAVLARAGELGLSPDRVEARSVSHEEVPSALADVHATYFLIRPRGSKVASAATKFGESLAMGIPVMANRGVGDSAAVIEEEGVGVVVESLDSVGYERAANDLVRLIGDPHLSARCRAVAEARYGLPGAIDAYESLYSEVGVPPSHAGERSSTLPRTSLTRRRRIVVLSPYPERRAPSQRLKYEQYFDSWRAEGFEVDVRPFWSAESWSRLYSDGGLLAKARDFAEGVARRRQDLVAAMDADLVYVHLWAVPLGPPWLERRLKAAGVPMVYDVDDLVHLPHASRANPFMRWLRREDKVAELLAMADEVIVCTEHLATFARRFNGRVTNISSTIDTRAYRARRHRDVTRGVVVGWSGSHSTAPYLHLLDDVLRELQRTDHVRVKVIGDPAFSIPGVRVEASAWRLETEVEDLSEIDVGVYPLPHEEWVLGKSGLKALQYMALEIPPVAERVGANLQIIRHGENGLLAGSSEEWLAELRRLVRTPELRRRLGKEARVTVENRYSVAANRATYLSVLERALEKR